MYEKADELSFEQVEMMVNNAIQRLEEQDLYLFENNASERAIAHRFAVYLEDEFLDWNVDCEYNLLQPDEQDRIRFKHASLIKRRQEGHIVELAEEESVSVYPDIIIHRRGTQENLLAIEVKKSKDGLERDFDILKLTAYRRDAHLNYRFALFIRFQNPEEEGSIVDEGLRQWV